MTVPESVHIVRIIRLTITDIRDIVHLRQTADSLVGIFQGAYQHPMLQMLLQVALYAAVGIAYLPRHAPHPAHIALAEQQRDRHYEQHHTCKAQVHLREKKQGAGQLRECHENGRQRVAQRIGDRIYVAFHPVEHVAGMELFTPEPAALHQVHKKPAAQSVA